MKRISLDTQMFHEAVISFMDKCKPDPLVKKQIQTLQLDWSEDETFHFHEGEFLSRNSLKSIIQGVLKISNEYSCVNFNATCIWCNDIDSHHEMFFSLNASATFNDIQPAKMKSTNDTNTRKDNKVNKKAHSRVIQRLKGDRLVSRLLDGNQILLAEAHVKFNCDGPEFHGITKLEERVITSADGMEGLKKLIFSLMESNIDVIEFLLHLPYLPREIKGTRIKPSYELGERVALRLLEDVMLDECENEGEDQLLEDLHLSDDIVMMNNSKRTKKEGHVNNTP
jgi:hypothetical protein